MGRRKYNNTTNQKLHREFCEVCGCTDKEVLHHHHIIEQTEKNTSNDPFNLAVLCANCHNLLHQSDKLEIIGVYPSTAKYGRILIYKLNGKQNIPGINEPYFKPTNPQTKLFGK